MGESGLLEIFYALAKVLAKGGAVLFGLVCVSILWLHFSERLQK
ncbi:MAG: hypothetical protein WAU81_04150 [Candidatus Aminicenantales bacterium]